MVDYFVSYLFVVSTLSHTACFLSQVYLTAYKVLL